MDSRTDDRDAKKSADEATDNPFDANKDNAGEQAAELQTDEAGERDNPDRFAPDPAAETEQPGLSAHDAELIARKTEVREP